MGKSVCRGDLDCQADDLGLLMFLRQACKILELSSLVSSGKLSVSDEKRDKMQCRAFQPQGLTAILVNVFVVDGHGYWGPTVLRQIRILSHSPPFLPPKSGRLTSGHPWDRLR